MKGNNDNSVRSAIAKLGIGEELKFPLERINTIRKYCYDLNAVHFGEIKFSAKTDRFERVIVVKRVL